MVFTAAEAIIRMLHTDALVFVLVSVPISMGNADRTRDTLKIVCAMSHYR